MATMRDVAERAGVSITTVSHVINETRTVSEEARSLVWNAVEELGYQPNVLARGLRRGETLTIGMIVPDNANPFFAEIARAVEDTTYENGLNVILCNSDGNLDRELDHARLLVNKRVDGILFIAAGASMDHIKALQEQRVPVVVVDREIPAAQVDTVQTDNEKGGYLATMHLLTEGHSRIGCIRGPSMFTPSAQRVSGYGRALAAAGIKLDESLIVRGDFQLETAYLGTEQLMTLENPPTAIFACNDLMALGAISALVKRGIRVPEDVSVVGFDDIPLAEFSNPALTTIVQPSYEMGTLAATILIDRINEPGGPIRQEVLDTRLIVRHSTARYGRGRIVANR